MTPKEKAKELVGLFEFSNESPIHRNDIDCALVCVDIIDKIFVKTTPQDNPYEYLFQLEYWQEVKKEITNLQ